MAMNPKDRAALERAPLHLLPSVGKIYASLACAEGALKYGPYNWREAPISLLGYTGAIERHLLALRDGQWIDQASGLPHLAKIAATAMILLDAWANRMMLDDVPIPAVHTAGHGVSAVALEEAIGLMKSLLTRYPAEPEKPAEYVALDTEGRVRQVRAALASTPGDVCSYWDQKDCHCGLAGSHDFPDDQSGCWCYGRARHVVAKENAK